MRYSPKQYAAAFLASLAESSPKLRKDLIRRFLFAIIRRGDQRHLPAIIREIEREHLRERGVTVAEITSASPLPATVKRHIAAKLGKRSQIRERVDPHVIAGLRIIANENTLIDASAASLLKRMFEKSGAL